MRRRAVDDEEKNQSRRPISSDERVDAPEHAVRLKERDKDNFEFIANVKQFVDVSAKTTVKIRFEARACEKTLALFEGEIDLKQELLQLGDDAAGYLFNVGHGFALFVHFADRNQISSIVFLGKLDNMAP